MNLLEGISDKEITRKLIFIAILAVLFAVLGFLLHLLFPNFLPLRDAGAGGWIFSTEFIGFMLVMCGSYAYHFFKIFIVLHK
jgi:hypothetical protein